METDYWKERPSQMEPHRRVFVGGVGQGGIASLAYGLEDDPLSGVICWSGYLLKSIKAVNTERSSYLLIHGLED